MDKLPPMTDMAYDEEDKEEMAARTVLGPMDGPKYPYGLQISLTHRELEKLGLEACDFNMGEIYHLFAFAKVTGVSETDNETGKTCCVTMQIIALSGEDEDEENDEENAAMAEQEPERPASKRPRRNVYF